MFKRICSVIAVFSFIFMSHSAQAASYSCEATFFDVLGKKLGDMEIEGTDHGRVITVQPTVFFEEYPQSIGLEISAAMFTIGFRSRIKVFRYEDYPRGEQLLLETRSVPMDQPSTFMVEKYKLVYQCNIRP